MKHLLIVAAMIPTATACDGKKAEVPAATAHDCAAAAKNLAAITFISVRKAHPNVDGGGETAIAAEAKTNCVAYQWSAETAKCYASGKTEAELRSCAKLLTPTQDQSFDQALKKVSFEEPALAATHAAPTGADADPCKHYADAFDKVIACEKLPRDRRDGVVESKQAMAERFAGYTALAAEARKAMDASCTQGIAALQQLAPDCEL